MSWKCEHGLLKTRCDECRLPPVDPEERRRRLLAGIPDWDKTWHLLRQECQGRIKRLIINTHEVEGRSSQWESVFDPLPRTYKFKEREDPATVRGSVTLTLIKMLFFTINDKLYDNYNAGSTWDELKLHIGPKGANGLHNLASEGKIRFHGCNAAWSKQQRQPGFLLSENAWQVIDFLCFGNTNESAANLSDDAIIDRLTQTQKLGEQLGASPTIPQCSKLLHIMNPTRWPVTNTRANSSVAAYIGLNIEQPNNPSKYLLFTQALRKFRDQEGFEDLAAVDIFFSHTYQDKTGGKEA